MNNLRKSQSAPVIDHFKQKQSTKLSTGFVDRKKCKIFYNFFHFWYWQGVVRSLKCAPILC